MIDVFYIYRTSDKLYDYSAPLYYTLLPDGLPDPLPEQEQYMSSGINRGIFESENKIFIAMVNDIINEEFIEDILINSVPKDSYYIIGKEKTTETDIYFRESYPSSEGEKYTLNNNRTLEKIICGHLFIKNIRNLF